MPRPRIRYMHPEAFHPRQAPQMLDTVAATLQRPISARHMQPVESGVRLRELVTPFADHCREHAEAPGFSAWPESAAQALGSGLAAMGSALGEGDVVHLSFMCGFLGPIRSDARRDFAHMIDLSRTWAHECVVCSADGYQGFWLEHEAVDAVYGIPYPFELVIWGAWQDLACRLLPFELAAQEA